MHRLSKISASFGSKKSEQNEGSGANDKNDKKFPRPSVLRLTNKDDSTDAVNESNGKHDEWYEMVTAITPSNDGLSRSDQKEGNEAAIGTLNNTLGGSSLDQIDLEPDNAAEIEALEQSLTALLDDFRSGRMCALSEERLKMMRKARQEMEDLTAFHVKLHKMQAPNLLTSSDDNGLDEQYDVLFRKLDKLHSFLCDMSFGVTDAKEGSTPDTLDEENGTETGE